MKKHATNSKEELKKMEKDAVKVFAAGSGIVFAAAITYAYMTGNMLCFEILIGVVMFLVVFLGLLFRPKKEDRIHEYQKA